MDLSREWFKIGLFCCLNYNLNLWVFQKERRSPTYFHPKCEGWIDSKGMSYYIGIRADESFRTYNRDKFSDKSIVEHFPFVEYNITKNDVENILEKCGIGYSDYYKWRKRSGCYFCMFQSKKDWLNLYYNHPQLYKKAMSYEYAQTDYGKRKRFGWNSEISLKDLIKPKNIKIVEEEYNKLKRKNSNHFKICSTKLIDLF